MLKTFFSCVSIKLNEKCDICFVAGDRIALDHIFKTQIIYH